MTAPPSLLAARLDATIKRMARKTSAMIDETSPARSYRGNHNGAKTHCPSGHEYGGSNVAIRNRTRDGASWTERRCIACRRLQRHVGEARRR